MSIQLLPATARRDLNAYIVNVTPDFAAVLYTDAPANGEAQPLEPMDMVALEKRMATTLPDGWKLGQIKAEQPNTSYSEFKREILGEIGRCMQIPINLLIGDSSKHNYASGRLDHQGYYRNIHVEQSLCEQIVLRPIFDAWYREACRLRLFVPPKNLFPLQRTGNHWKRTFPPGGSSICGEAACFFWDGVEHVDPLKEAKAAVARIDSHVSNLAVECARYGRDWEDVLTQAAKEEKLISKLGLAKKPSPQVTTRRKRPHEKPETDESDIRSESDPVRRRKRNNESGGEW